MSGTTGHLALSSTGYVGDGSCVIQLGHVRNSVFVAVCGKHIRDGVHITENIASVCPPHFSHPFSFPTPVYWLRNIWCHLVYFTRMLYRVWLYVYSYTLVSI